MPDAIRAAVLREVHRSIGDAADAGVARTAGASTGNDGATVLDYPPADSQSDDHILTEAEGTALAKIATSEVARNGLRKLLCEAASRPMFHLFCLLDGVADPRDWSGDVWLGADLVPPQGDEDREMLHDDFLESYREFVQQGRRR